MQNNEKVKKVLIFSEDVRTRVRKPVPSIKGAWVEFYDDVPAAFNSEYEKQSKVLSDEDLVYWGVTRIVSNWNFYKTEKDKLEITIDSIKNLPYKVQRWLVQQSTDIALSDTEEKKR